MERAGTGKNYVGLYGAVRAYRRPTSAALDRAPAEFPEVAPTPPMTEAMVGIEQRFEGLRLCRKEAWKAPKEHPELQPEHEALQLRELFHELGRTSDVRSHTTDFHRRMREAEEASTALEAALWQGDRDQADNLLEVVSAGCASCHAAHRDVPQPR